MTRGYARPLAWLWRGMIVLFLLLAAEQIAEGFAAALLESPGGPGEALGINVPDRVSWRLVRQVLPDGAADRAALQAGDRIHSDRFGDFNFQPGSHVPLTVERGGERFDVTLIAKAPEARDSATVGLILAIVLVRLVLLGLIVLLLVRGRGNHAATMLAVGLMVLFTDFNTVWLPQWAATAMHLLIWLPLTAASPYCQIRFAMAISGAAGDRRQARLALCVGAASGGANALYKLMADGLIPPADAIVWLVLLLGGAVLCNLTVVAILAVNYRRGDTQTRNRIKVVVSAFICILLGWVILGIVLRSAGVAPLAAAWISTPVSFLGLGLLTYAVLRQKLFDLNFALNRALVYGAVSFLLLAAFGLAKWVIEHLIPESWHAGSEYYSVAIALGLFLVLHRVHNWVERNVERFLFSPWHRNEETLRRFVTAAGHFDETAALCRAFAGEASRFAKGAGAALYLREPDGSYTLGCGSLASALSDYAADDLALALMRAERRPVRTAETQTTLPGALALPMLDHGRLAGFLLLDRKPDGADYRPDEVEVLGWAAHQVGLDLQAMRASELEAEVAALNERLASAGDRLALLTDERDRLASLLAGPAVARKEA